MKKFFRFIIFTLLATVTFVVMLAALVHTYSPIYIFREPTPFVGGKIYNPYHGMDSVRWYKGNFHGHTNFDVDTIYTTAQFVDAYRATGYNIIGVADHQSINREVGDREGFIPTYEHGYNMANFHQGMIGAESVSIYESPLMWLRWPYRLLTVSQMQRTFDVLRPDAKLLVFNHPERLRLVPDDIFNKLNNYDLWELNPDRADGAPLWDMALSSGHYAPMLASDDAHSYKNRLSWFQSSFTMVGAPSTDSTAVLSAIARGCSYGVRLPEELNTPQTHASFPRLKYIGLVGADSVVIELDSAGGVPERIDFIGQDGRVLQSDRGVLTARCVFSPEQSYIRVEAHYPHDIVLTFNPFARSADGAVPPPTARPQVDLLATVLNSLFWFAVAVVLFMIMLRFARRTRKRKLNNYRYPTNPTVRFR